MQRGPEAAHQVVASPAADIAASVAASEDGKRGKREGKQERRRRGGGPTLRGGGEIRLPVGPV